METFVVFVCVCVVVFCFLFQNNFNKLIIADPLIINNNIIIIL